MRDKDAQLMGEIYTNINTSVITESKYNNKDYKFYVYANDKIYSGWEYSEDAKDEVAEMKEWKPPVSAKVYKRAKLVSLGLDRSL